MGTRVSDLWVALTVGDVFTLLGAMVVLWVVWVALELVVTVVVMWWLGRRGRRRR